MPITTSRRGLLKAGLLASTALALGAGLATFSGFERQPARSLGYRFLREHDLLFLAALVPVVLAANYPGPLADKAEARALKALDSLMFNLDFYSQQQLLQLFDLMALGPARVIAGGPMHSWQQASAAAVNTFLLSWRDSMLPLKRMGYTSLTKLIVNSWYAQPENISLAGYPGPPKKIPS